MGSLKGRDEGSADGTDGAMDFFNDGDTVGIKVTVLGADDGVKVGFLDFTGEEVGDELVGE